MGAGSIGRADGTRPDWNGDLDFFKRELPTRHLNLFFQTDRAYFDGGVEALKREADRLSGADVALRLQELVVSLGDDHTAVGWLQLPPVQPPEALRLGIQWFSDGWRIVAVERHRSKLLGAKLVAVNGLDMPDVERRIGLLLSHNPAVVKWQMPGLFALPVALRHCRLASGNGVSLRLESDTGEFSEAVYSFAEDAGRDRSRLVSFQPKSIPFGLRDPRTILWSRLLADDRVFYAQYNRCHGREVAERLGDAKGAAQLPSLEALFAGVFDELRTAIEQGKAEVFVIDLRHNPGGASDFGTRFAEKVAALPALSRPGGVYVIVGRRTFSSAIINAMDFRRLCGAQLVGEIPGGTPNHYGETRTFELPSSRLPVTYSTKYFERLKGAGLAPLKPDLSAELSFADYAAGVDRPLEAVLTAVRNRPKRGAGE